MASLSTLTRRSISASISATVGARGSSANIRAISASVNVRDGAGSCLGAGSGFLLRLAGQPAVKLLGLRDDVGLAGNPRLEIVAPDLDRALQGFVEAAHLGFGVQCVSLFKVHQRHHTVVLNHATARESRFAHDTGNRHRSARASV